MRRVFARFCIAFTIVVLIVEFSPVAPWYARALAGSWTDPDGDILIVLSADEQPDGFAGPASFGRALYAVRVWRTGHFRAVVVSGGRTQGASGSLAAAIGGFFLAF